MNTYECVNMTFVLPMCYYKCYQYVLKKRARAKQQQISNSHLMVMVQSAVTEQFAQMDVPVDVLKGRVRDSA